MSQNESQAVAVTAVKAVHPAIAELKRPPGPVEKLKAERVQLWLEGKADWSLNHKATALSRVLAFPGQQVATAYASFVSEFAAALNIPVTLGIHGGQVITRLHAPAPLGCQGDATDLVLDFAEMLG